MRKLRAAHTDQCNGGNRLLGSTFLHPSGGGRGRNYLLGTHIYNLVGGWVGNGGEVRRLGGVPDTGHDVMEVWSFPIPEGSSSMKRVWPILGL